MTPKNTVKGCALSLQGEKHRQRNIPCQDRYFQLADCSHATIVLCDGCGSASLAAPAAEIVSQIVGRLLHKNFIRYLYQEPLKVRLEVAQAVEQALQQYAEENAADPRQLACTIVAGSLDQSGRMICFHLGDGGILAQCGEGGGLVRVSLPENGLTDQQTFMTMNCTLIRHLRLYRRTEKVTRKLFLYTDGLSVARQAPFDLDLEELLRSGRKTQLISYLRAHSTGDDQSIAVLCCTDH